MKILIFLSLFISINSFGQSVTISPQTIDKQNSNSDDLKVTSYNKPPSIVGLRGNGTVLAKTGVLLGDLLMKIEGKGYDGFLGFFNGGRIGFKATQNWGATNGGAITFETTPNTDSSPLERMVINHDGRVGIGTPTPTAQLDVMRGTAPDGTAIFRGTTHVSHFNYSTNENTYIRGGKNGSNVIINDIAGLGFVGIGTNSPQAKLHLSQGNLRVDALAGNGNVSLYADDQGTVSGALPIAFSAYNSNNLATNISSGIETTFPFATEEYDLGGFYNNATYEFSAPLNAIYHFDAFVKFGAVSSTTSSALYSLYFYIDSGLSSVVDKPIYVGSFNTLNFSQDVKLNAGQKVKIRVIQTSGNSLQLIGGISSKFTGHLAIRL